MNVPRYNLKAILALVAMAAVLSAWFKAWFVHDRPPSLFTPIETSVHRLPDGHTELDLIIHPVGDYAVLDIGSIRLAVESEPVSRPPLPHRKRSQVRYRLEPKNNRERRGHRQTGRVRFSHRNIDYGCTCNFVGLSFDIVNDNLHLRGDSYPVEGAQRVIIIDATGKIKDVVQLSAKGPQHIRETQISHRD